MGTLNADLRLLEKNSLDRIKARVYVGLHNGPYWLHWHQQIELLLFLTDDAKVLCADKLFYANAGDMIVVNPCELHQNFGGTYYCVHIQNSFFKDIGYEYTNILPFIKADSEILAMVEQMWQAAQEKSEWSLLDVQSYAYKLMSYLVKNFKAEASISGDEALKTNRTSRIDEILYYVAKHCNEKITTAFLAENSHLNENYLCALFKSQMGMTIVDYINSFRIEKATELLQNKNLSITEIALHVGFDDPGYFTRVFKKHVGATPREYRKRPQDFPQLLINK